ncbi:hypothetical protein TKK_0016490 [Trichogramma kaykai]|uniref:Uncharacterized protein n=1 Tax=Trichogramma kaykai TaxID=54128 RepID=A0ABD2W6A0_9HYME
MDESILEVTRSINYTQTNIAVGQVCQKLPYFDGSSNVLFFLDDIENLKKIIPDEHHQTLLFTIISRLRGRARESLRGFEIETIDQLVKHLEDQFMVTKCYNQCVADLINTKMKVGETIRQFHDRLKALVGVAITAALISLTNKDIDQSEQLNNIVFMTFVKQIPDFIRPGIIAARPKTLNDALTAALDIEEFQVHVPPYHHKANVYYNNGEMLNVAQVTSASQTHRSRSPGAPRQIDFNDPAIFARDQMPYYFNPYDVYFPKTTIIDGKINAPAALSYSTPVDGPTQPASILKRSGIDRGEVTLPPPSHALPYPGYWPPHYQNPYFSQFYGPPPFMHPNFYNQRMPQNLENHNRSKSPSSSGNHLNYEGARRQVSASNVSQHKSAVRFMKADESTQPEEPEFHHQQN